MNKTVIFLILLMACSQSFAELQTKKIVKVGCHRGDGTCFAYVDTDISSNANCNGNDRSFRWDLSSVNGQSFLSMLLAAELADKSVTFAETGCFGGFPSFSYLLINK